MSNSAQKQVQTVSQAMQAVDTRKGVKPEPTKKLVHESESNDVIGTYLGLILGKPWGKGRGSDKLRKAMGGNNFAVFTRI
jgi:hypothetical protein